jgi:4-hydroxy-4-methyl-2-oxoglutarate aldolase
MTELALAEQLAQFATPTLFEASDRVAALPPAIKPLSTPTNVSGLAYTVMAEPGDNAVVHWALAEAPPGSVLVVAIGGDIQRAFWGEIMTEAAIARDIRGLVTDGAVRDSREIRRLSFPVFCAGTAIAGPGKSRRGELGRPIVLGQTLIHTGDIIVGDDDGVVVIPRDEAMNVIERARERQNKENTIIERVRLGHLTVDLLNLRKNEQRVSPQVNGDEPSDVMREKDADVE